MNTLKNSHWGGKILRKQEKDYIYIVRLFTCFKKQKKIFNKLSETKTGSKTAEGTCSTKSE